MNTHSGELPPIPKNRIQEIQESIAGSMAALLVVGGILFLPLFIWFACRIEPDTGEIAVLIHKTGKDLPSGEIIATEEGQKGIQLDVLSEGRYFRNPYTWGWKIHKIIDIPSGKLGVMTRLYGKELPQDMIIADEGTKGIMAEILRPGKYRINPYAFSLGLFDAISIRPGNVGIVTSLIGDDIINNNIPQENRNSFIVTENQKGVIGAVLDPGTYYLNPYIVNVVEVNLQSQRFEMSDGDAITFLTLDGFTVTVEGTIEYAIMSKDAALLTHRVGAMDDIISKLILPRARGFSRIEGSKHPAIDFIVGETRQKFQDELELDLGKRCVDWGVDIKSVLVRRITVPDEIASINREREIAVQDAKKFEQQLAQAKSQAELVKQEMLAEQNRAKVESDTVRIRSVIKAEKDQEVNVISASKDLQVAKVDYDAALFQAEAIISTAKGEGAAIKAQNIAEASILADQVKAFDNGINLSRYLFYQKVAPMIETVLSTDDGGGLGTIFTPLLPDKKGGSK